MLEASQGFPGGSVVKNSPANAGDKGLIPGREDPLEKEMEPTLVSLPGKSHRQRSLVGHSLWSRKDNLTTKQQSGFGPTTLSKLLL